MGVLSGKSVLSVGFGGCGGCGGGCGGGAAAAASVVDAFGFEIWNCGL
jgi:hypothetical protein